MVDSGYFTSDERDAHGGLRPDVLVKDDWVLKAFNEFPVDVVNVSSHDLRYFSNLLEKKEFYSRQSAQPVLDRLVSANTVSEAPGLISLRPFVVREVPAREAGGKSVRVAFVGLTELSPAPPPGFKFADMVETAKRVVPEAKKQADLVVLLAKAGAEEAGQIARAVPGIDVIIAGNSVTIEQSFTPPLYAGQTLIVFTPFETRMLGELRFYASAQSKFTTKQRFITLDEMAVPEDAAAKKLVDAATVAETDMRSNASKMLETWQASTNDQVVARALRLSPAVSGSTATYVTSSACSQCHLAQYIKWTNTTHAKATDPLAARAIEFQAACLNCHATGSENASAKTVVAKLQNVQCEQCHGPASLHVAKPAKGYGRIASMQANCATCHTAATSPGFDPKTEWEKIKH